MKHSLLLQATSSQTLDIILTALATLFSGLVLYLFKDKVESIEEAIYNTEKEIDEVKDMISNERRRREIEHRAVVNWLFEITEYIRNEDKEDINVPDRVNIEPDIDVFDDKDDENNFYRGGGDIDDEDKDE